MQALQEVAGKSTPKVEEEKSRNGRCALVKRGSYEHVQKGRFLDREDHLPRRTVFFARNDRLKKEQEFDVSYFNATSRAFSLDL